jgi:glycine/D-amino acid oxidase-like deaminating enzyme
MLSRPGMVLHTKPIATRLSHILASPEQELRQSPHGHLIAPLAAAHQADVREQIDTPPAELAATTLARLQLLLPGVTLHLASAHSANRPVPGDGLPAAGPTGIDGLTLAVMHSGVTLAPLIAELLAAEITWQAVSPMLADFRPQRFFSPQA